MLLSGGIDSAACLYLAKGRGFTNRALTVRFHGMAQGELRAATRVAKAAGVAEHRFLSMPQLMELSDMEARRRLSGLPPTYIPMKNATYYSLAAGYAEETGSTYLVGGHNRDDTRFFEDTSDEFFDLLQRAIRAGSARLRQRRVRIWRPLKAMPKARVVSLAYRLGVPLDLTWSCHVSGTEHCWRCDGCRGRRRSFAEAGVADPLMR